MCKIYFTVLMTRQRGTTKYCPLSEYNDNKQEEDTIIPVLLSIFTPDEKSLTMTKKLRAICSSPSQKDLDSVCDNIRIVFPEYLYDESFVIEIDGKVVLPTDPQKFSDCVKGLKIKNIVAKTQKKIKDKKLQIMNGSEMIFEFTANEAIIKDVWKKNWSELRNKVSECLKLKNNETFILLSRADSRDNKFENADELKDHFDKMLINDSSHTFQILVVSFALFHLFFLLGKKSYLICLIFEYEGNRVSWVPSSSLIPTEISKYDWHNEFVEMKRFIISQFNLGDGYILLRNAQDKVSTIDERNLKQIWEEILLKQNSLTIFQIVIEATKQLETKEDEIQKTKKNLQSEQFCTNNFNLVASSLAEWLEQKGFEKYIETIIEDGGITDKQGLQKDFDEVCKLLSLSDEGKTNLKKLFLQWMHALWMKCRFAFVCFDAYPFTVYILNVHCKFCEGCNIVRFKDALIKANYTDPKMFLNKTEEELDKIGKAAEMKLGYLRRFKEMVLEQQKIEFEVNAIIATTFFFEKKIKLRVTLLLYSNEFSQKLKEHGIKSKCELVSKSDSKLVELCKKYSTQPSFASRFLTAVRKLQKKTQSLTRIEPNSFKLLADSYELALKLINVGQRNQVEFCNEIQILRDYLGIDPPDNGELRD
ncbi:hypothetical protein RFI_05800, partial [Reticulomyxa filosa]